MGEGLEGESHLAGQNALGKPAWRRMALAVWRLGTPTGTARFRRVIGPSSCELFQRGTGLAENSLCSQAFQDSDDSCDVPWHEWRTAAVGFPVAYNSVIGHHQLVFGDPGGDDFRRQSVTYSGTQYGNNVILGELGHAEFLATVAALRSVIALPVLGCMH